MGLIILNLIIGIIVALYLGFDAWHYGFFTQVVSQVNGVSLIQNRTFNFLSPMLWFIILDFVFLIVLLIKFKALSDKAQKVISILAPIWTIITILVCLEAALYN